MGYSAKINWEPLRTLNAATLAGAYVAVGTPLANASYILKIINDSNVAITVSINGTSDIDYVPAGGFFLYDEAKTLTHEGVPQGTQIFVKGAVGVGTIAVASQFQVIT